MFEAIENSEDEVVSELAIVEEDSKVDVVEIDDAAATMPIVIKAVGRISQL